MSSLKALNSSNLQLSKNKNYRKQIIFERWQYTTQSMLNPLILISTSSRLTATLPIHLEVYLKDKLPKWRICSWRTGHAQDIEISYVCSRLQSPYSAICKIYEIPKKTEKPFCKTKRKKTVRFHLSQPISRCPQELSKNLNIPLSEKMMHPFFSMPNGDLIHVPMPDAFCARTKMARTDLLSPICVATTKY